MTLETPLPTLWFPKTISSDQDFDQLDRALNDLMREDLVEEDLWISDFIQRLNYAISDIGRKK